MDVCTAHVPISTWWNVLAVGSATVFHLFCFEGPGQVATNLRYGAADPGATTLCGAA